MLWLLWFGYLLNVLDVLDSLNWFAVLDCDACARSIGFVGSAGNMRHVELFVGVPTF